MFLLKIVPPSEFEPHSKQISGRKVLNPVALQTIAPIRNTNCSRISYDNETSMTYANFSKLAMEKQSEFESLSIEEMENRFWNPARMHKNVAQYGLDNSFSLFGNECQLWNLSKFTNIESLIHQVSNLIHFYR